MRAFDLRTSPLQFQRVEPGVYLSTCGEPDRHRNRRELAVEIVDRRYRYTMEHAPDPEQHRSEYQLEDDRLAECPWDACHRGACGRYRIHRTEHTGRNVSKEGRTRWWVRDIAGDCSVYFEGYGRSRHFLSLERAVESLCLKVGQGVRDGFEVLCRLRRETARDDELRIAANAERERRIALVQSILSRADAPRTIPAATEIVDSLFPGDIPRCRDTIG